MDSVIQVSDENGTASPIIEPLLSSHKEEKSNQLATNRNDSSDEEEPPLSRVPTLGQFIAESKRLGVLAFPLVGMYVCAFAMGIISVGFVGHLGDPQELAGAALATVYANVTGYSVIVGLASVMETLCGQAYGAELYHQVGEVLQRSLAVLNAICVPILVLWLFTENILTLVGQDATIAYMASQYVLWNIPGLFIRAWSEPIEKYLQAQNETLPLGLSNIFSLLVHIPMSYVFIYVLGFGYLGAAMAYSMSTFVNLVFLLIWMAATGVWRKTWGGWTASAFKGWGSYLALAIPSATMICLEWWCYEIIIVLAGLLPDPELKVSAMSININFVMVCIMIPMGIGDGASTRVSNELGAGKPGKARLAALTAVAWAFSVGLVVATVMFTQRHTIGMVFLGQGQPEVVTEVAKLVPLLSISIAFDCCQMTISGVLRGSGRQHIGAYVNLVAYYAVAIPVGCLATFYYDFGVEGLWFGLLCGALCQDTALATVLFRTDWLLEASRSTDLVKEQSRLSRENKM